jgi:hypothetical protein
MAKFRITSAIDATVQPTIIEADRFQRDDGFVTLFLNDVPVALLSNVNVVLVQEPSA